MPDTFFTQAPHWRWLIVWYFFLGGIAGGSYFLAALLDLWGDPEDRRLVRLGYYVSLVGVVISGVLLTVDLNRPERFWHMLIMSERGWPMFKYWSPMSVGSWALLVFGFFAFLSSLGALAEEGRVRWPPLSRLRGGLPGTLLAVAGGVCGFFVAGYTGVLLSVTNRPLWADTTLLGVLFLFSAASTAAAALMLLGRWRGARPDTLRWLAWLDSRALILELIVLIALVVSLGAVARLWLSPWGLLLGIGVVLAGILFPLALHARPGVFGRSGPLAAAVLVLIGGFLLRVVVVLTAESV
ncbi:MAG: NrfD/PsrC family molybdoenzyme membrane anchor subunit [Thermodesulfobacteriota bacterium]|jgi:formate-dependent nitrite reductase membrane component NrfD